MRSQQLHMAKHSQEPRRAVVVVAVAVAVEVEAEAAAAAAAERPRHSLICQVRLMAAHSLLLRIIG